MKIVDAPRVGSGVDALRASGLLAEFCPEVAAIDDVVWRDLVAALASPPPSRAARLAMITHYAEGDLEGRFRALRFSKHERREVVHLLSFRDVQPQHLLDGPTVKGFVAEATRDALAPLLAFRGALGDGETRAQWAALAQRIDDLGALEAPLHPRELAIDGRVIIDTLGVRPSRRIGDTLMILLKAVWREPALNTKEGLLEHLAAAYDAAGEGSP